MLSVEYHYSQFGVCCKTLWGFPKGQGQLCSHRWLWGQGGKRLLPTPLSSGTSGATTWSDFSQFPTGLTGPPWAPFSRPWMEFIYLAYPFLQQQQQNQIFTSGGRRHEKKPFYKRRISKEKGKAPECRPLKG